MKIRLRTLRPTTALVLAFFALATGSANAVTPVAGTTPTAYVRAAHFSPDTGGVDVYLTAFSGGTSTLWLSAVGYGDVSPYRSVTAGNYAVSMRPHGAAASTAAVLTWSLALSPGATYTAAAVGLNSQLHGVVIPDSLTPSPAGTALVRVIEASSQAGHIGVQLSNGTVITSDTAFGSSSEYVSVPAGAWTAKATSSTQSTLSASSPVTLASGSVSSVVVLDEAGGGLTLRTVTDAAGAPTMPSGSVPAGGGGTAIRHPFDTGAWAAFGGAVLVALTFLRPRRRKRSPV